MFFKIYIGRKIQPIVATRDYPTRESNTDKPLVWKDYLYTFVKNHESDNSLVYVRDETRTYVRDETSGEEIFDPVPRDCFEKISDDWLKHVRRI